MLRYQDEGLFYNLCIANILSAYSLYDTPALFKKMTNDVQNIAPTQITDQHITVDQSIQFVNRNLGLCA